LGGRTRHHDGDVSHSDAVSRHASVRTHRAAGRILTRDWDLYDTRNVVYQPARLTPEALKAGYDWAYREFYRWSVITQASLSHGSLKHQAKHFFYAAGWKKFEPLWDAVIRARQLRAMTPVLESVLSKVTAKRPAADPTTLAAARSPLA
jgi:hypothetical protein